MIMFPTISVIIPAYNAEKYITEAIDSVLNQSYKNLQLIVVNDGSTDRTLEIINKYSDNRMKIISIQNGGVSKARNIGLDNAIGEYIVFLDADDKYLLNAFQKMIEYCLASNADICAFQTTTSPKCRKSIESYEGTEMLQLSGKNNYNTIYINGKIYRKEFINNTRFNVSMRVCEDSLFLFELAIKRPKLVIYSDIVYFYRISDDSLSRPKSLNDNWKNILTVSEIKSRVLAETNFNMLSENIKIKSRMAVLNYLIRDKDNIWEKEAKEFILYIKKNKRYYIPTSNREKLFFGLIIINLYFLYKKIYTLLRQ